MKNLFKKPPTELSILLLKFKEMYLTNSRFSKKSSGKVESKDSNRLPFFSESSKAYSFTFRDYKAIHYCEVVFQWIKESYSPHQDLSIQVATFIVP